jgi:hypothetical protein
MGLSHLDRAFYHYLWNYHHLDYVVLSAGTPEA